MRVSNRKGKKHHPPKNEGPKRGKAEVEEVKPSHGLKL